MTMSADSWHVVRLVARSDDALAREVGCDAETGACLRTVQEHTDSVYNIAISADGARVVTESYDTLAKEWDAETGA
jgi:WD40 repeat protein